MLQKLESLLSHPVCVDFSSIQTHAKDAKAMLAVIQEFLSTQDRRSRTMEWLGWLLHAMSDAEECIDKFHLREDLERHALPMAARPFAALVSKCKLWRDLSTLVKKLKGLCRDQFLKEEVEAKRKNEPASVPRQEKRLARLTNFWDQQVLASFVCHEAQKKKIMKWMKEESEESEVISIVGKQGTGKTFLARWVFSQAKYMDYEKRAWVRVSGSLDKREFLLEILKQVEKLEREMKDIDTKEIMRRLRWKLARTTRFLLVLDDVQPSDEPFVRELVMNIPPYSKKGRIIITTRDYMIASFLNTSEGGPIWLIELGGQKSQEMLDWKLHKVPGGQRVSNEEDILNMCSGLPLYISLLGGFLSNAEVHERAVLAEEDFMMTPLDILELSCHKLPVHLKPCFIYMALFPVAFPIPTRRLVRLWLAEGLLDSHCYNIEKLPEDVGEMFILELADSNVIDVVSWRADGSPKACQMLTSLYDMIRPIAMSTGFMHIHAAYRNPTGQQQQLPQLLERTKVRWLAEHTNIVTDSRGGNLPDLYLNRVRSFLSFYMRRGILTKDISTVLRNMTSKTAYSLLRVLDLEGVYKPSLQGVLHKLVLLRYLGLRSTVLDSLPSAVVNLHYLETLDIKHTNITSLPSSLWKGRNLRHLHLNWFYINLKTILKACSNDVKALTKLQTLSGLVIGDVKENLMRDHVDCLTTLTALKLLLRRSGWDSSGSAGKAVANWISLRLTNLRSLTFGVTKKAKPAEEAEPATSQIGPLPKLSLAKQHRELLELYLLGQLKKPIWTELLPGSLRALTLSGSKLVEDTMLELGGLLRNLRTFRLLANSFLGTSLMFNKDEFPSLVILKIWKLPQLEEVIIGQGAMQHLKELEFRHLDKLRTVTGIKERQEVENICVVVKQDAPSFVDQEMENLYKIEDIETPESADDDEDDSSDDDEDDLP